MRKKASGGLAVKRKVPGSPPAEGAVVREPNVRLHDRASTRRLSDAEEAQSKNGSASRKVTLYVGFPHQCSVQRVGGLSTADRRRQRG